MQCVRAFALLTTVAFAPPAVSLAPVATSARAASRNATPDAGVTLPSMDAFSFSPSDIEVEPVDLCCPASTPRSALTSAFTQLRQSDLAAEAAQVASALADHLAHQQMATLTAFNLVGSPSGYRQQQHQQPN